MAKTGESYATARSRLLAAHPGTTPDDSPLDWMPGALHISNGDATEVPGTGLARRVVYWRDILHEGPVPEVAPGRAEPPVHRLADPAPWTICPTTPRQIDGVTGLLEIFGSFLRILSVSVHEGERGGHGRSAS